MSKKRSYDFSLVVGDHKNKETGYVCLNSGNIAICGVTGSGKTSVIKTLMHSFMYHASGDIVDLYVISHFNASYKKILGDRFKCVNGYEETIKMMEELYNNAAELYQKDGTFTMIFIDGLDACLHIEEEVSMEGVNRLKYLFENAYTNGVSWVVSSQSYKHALWRGTGIDDFQGIILTTCYPGCWPGMETRTDQWTKAFKEQYGYKEFALSVEQVWSTIKDDGCWSGIVWPGVDLKYTTDEQLDAMYNLWVKR